MRHYFLALLSLLSIPACTDADWSQISALGEVAMLDCYSGARQIYHGRTTGKLHAEAHSDGWYFVEEPTGHLVRVSGACVVRQKTGTSAYASSHADFGTAADLWERPDCKRYIQDVADDVEQRHGVVFFVRPGVVPVKDGTRAEGDLDVAGVHSIDGAIKLLLELGRVRYVPIHATNFQERAMLVHSVLRYLS